MRNNLNNWRLWTTVALVVLAIAVINSRNYYIVRVKVVLGIADLYIPFHPIMRLEAELGSPEAQYKFAKTYLEHGYSNLEAKQVWLDAMPWFQRAADQVYGPAEFSIGRCYSFGYCGEKNAVEIAKWNRKSAEHGYWCGQDYLSSDYYSGHGVKQDYEQAYFWRQMASDTREKCGIVIAGSAELPYVSKLTLEQEAAIKKKVTEWEATHPPVCAEQ